VIVATEPVLGFEDSRRLTGPNRYFSDTAVILTPLGAAAAEARARSAWVDGVREMAAALGWPDPSPQVHGGAAGVQLVFRAPRDALFTATDVNEWAWEQAAASVGPYGYDRAQAVGDAPSAVFAARAAAERQPRLIALRDAAVARGLPVFEDDAWISLGAGAGSRGWPRETLPDPESVNWQDLHDVPTALVTGSNGKTTTVRLLADMAAAAGWVPGFSCTEGVYVGGEAVAAGDYSGPDGARSVLRHPRVQAAILETARGGILRRGLVVRRAQAAVVTNISADHLGEYGVDDAGDLAETKLAVAHAVREAGTLVLNADDAVLMRTAARLAPAAQSRQALFAAAYDHPALRALRAGGGSVCGVRDGQLLVSHGGIESSLGAVDGLPLSLGGAARHNVANLAAAVLAGLALGVPPAAVGRSVLRFGADPRDNPGRLECWRHGGARVLLDYAHNPDGLSQLLAVARSFAPRRLLLLLGQAGNRGDAAIDELARTAARFAPDRIVIKELVHMLRGRAAGEVPALLERSLLQAGMRPDQLSFVADEESAARALLAAAGEGDVVVLPVHTTAVRERLRAGP
jgi:UDP-N-acetylmuramyl tripeptide synthase